MWTGLRRGAGTCSGPPIKWFSKSSGTTSDRSKFIPVSQEALGGLPLPRRQDPTPLHYERIPQSRLYQGMSLVVGGSSAIEQFRPRHTAVTFGIIIRNLPVGGGGGACRARHHLDGGLGESWSRWHGARCARMCGASPGCLRGRCYPGGASRRSRAGTTSEVWPELELFMHGGVSFRPY